MKNSLQQFMKPRLRDSEGKIVSFKAKALTVEKVLENSDNTELKDLKQQIESLAMIMKSATVGNIKPKMGGESSSPLEKKEVSGRFSSEIPFQGLPEGLRGLELVQQDLLNQGRSL